MQYEYVESKDIVALRKQRLRLLELDHCTALLMLEENPQDPLTKQDIGELERRITHHRAILSPPNDNADSMACAEEQPAEDDPS